MSLIWFWNCVLVLQCEGGRGKESEAAIMAKDDNGEESGIRVRGNKEAKPKVELQKKNVWFVFVCVGGCYKVDEGMDFFFFFYLFILVVGGQGCGWWWWQLWLWLCAVVVVGVSSGSVFVGSERDENEIKK